MIIKRSLFSDTKSKKKSDKKGLSGEANIAIGVGTLAAGDIASKAITEKGAKALFDGKITAKDEEIVRKKLLESAKKQGIKVVEDPNGSNAAYTGSKAGKNIKDIVAKKAKELRKAGKDKEARELIRSIKEPVVLQTGSKKMFDNLGKDAVVLGKGELSKADVLSHELGHAQYMKKGRSKSVVGKVSHKLMPVSKIAAGPVGGIAAAVNGFKSGQKSVKAKREGKKESTWNKVRAVAVPAALAAPLLIGEGKASLNGLRAMKKAGASKELMKQSRKRLLGAWGTYAGHASKNVFVGAGAREIGKGYEKLKGEKK